MFKNTWRSWKGCHSACLLFALATIRLCLCFGPLQICSVCFLFNRELWELLYCTHVSLWTAGKLCLSDLPNLASLCFAVVLVLLSQNWPESVDRVRTPKLYQLLILPWILSPCSVLHTALYSMYCTLIKNKIKFSSYIRKFTLDRLQSHIWLTTSSYMVKYLRLFSYIRKPFLICDFATDIIWISLYIL